MTRLPRLLGSILLTVGALPAQDVSDYKVYTEAPRLMLGERRLRLLKRERERNSMRYEQLAVLMEGRAAMPEPGFAMALWSTVTGKPEPCRAAWNWSMKEAAVQDASAVRQMALVYDWCQASFNDIQLKQLGDRILPALRTDAASLPTWRSRLLAALAIADQHPAAAEKVARETANWWKREMLPLTKKDVGALRDPDHFLAAMEILHVMRDNFRIDLREDASRFFMNLPPYQLLTYYPQAWPAPENEYHIPVYYESADPDLRRSVLARAAELAMVAYDGNPQPIQFMQGWLMQDRFQLKSALGAPYEFLWANPYLPGLSYDYMPELFHSQGQLLVRGSWDENAVWFSVLAGKMQYFQDGRRVSLKPGGMMKPLKVGDVTIQFWRDNMRFEAGLLPAPTAEDERKTREELIFIVGAPPNKPFNVEVDQQEMYEAFSDEGGIIPLTFLRGYKTGVRVAPASH